jgi:hypothetical protein
LPGMASVRLQGMSRTKVEGQDWRSARAGAAVARPLPPGPTRHGPGTRGKLVVLAWREEHGFALWHPGDATGVTPITSNARSRAYTVRERRACRVALAQ